MTPNDAWGRVAQSATSPFMTHESHDTLQSDCLLIQSVCPSICLAEYATCLDDRPSQFDISFTGGFGVLFIFYNILGKP